MKNYLRIDLAQDPRVEHDRVRRHLFVVNTFTEVSSRVGRHVSPTSPTISEDRVESS